MHSFTNLKCRALIEGGSQVPASTLVEAGILPTSKVLTALDEVALLMTESMNGSSFRPNNAHAEKHANVILSLAASTDQSLEIDLQHSLPHTTH